MPVPTDYLPDFGRPIRLHENGLRYGMQPPSSQRAECDTTEVFVVFVVAVAVAAQAGTVIWQPCMPRRTTVTKPLTVIRLEIVRQLSLTMSSAIVRRKCGTLSFQMVIIPWLSGIRIAFARLRRRAVWSRELTPSSQALRGVLCPLVIQWRQKNYMLQCPMGICESRPFGAVKLRFRRCCALQLNSVLLQHHHGQGQQRMQQHIVRSHQLIATVSKSCLFQL
eukprot:SAG31_NODE_322_length_17726_cov_18.070006_15_plen_222_part_00